MIELFDSNDGRALRNKANILGFYDLVINQKKPRRRPQDHCCRRLCVTPENRCLVPFNSFAEYAPEPNPETKKKDVVWFALSDERPLFGWLGQRSIDVYLGWA
jgi:hypothetical protein